MLNKDLAICIRTIDYSETSQVLTFFTKQFGKIKAIAKGSRRAKSAFGGAIEVFSFGMIVFSQSSGEKLSILTEFEQRSFAGLAGNLVSLNCAMFAVELLHRLTKENDPHPQLFEDFCEFLKNVSKTKDESEPLIFLILFQLSLLKEVGLQPVLNYCVNCKTRYETGNRGNEVYFSSSAGGLVCKDCEAHFLDKVRLSRRCADVLANLKLIVNADRKILSDIEKVLIFHFTGVLGDRPKAAEYIEKMTNLC